MDTPSVALGQAMSAADVSSGGGAADVPSARTRAATTQWISSVALAMMTTSSVASLRAAPTMAVYGLACVFLYLLPAVVFLLPTSLVSAELASGWEGGIYNWVSRGHLQADGLPGGVVPVRDDDLLLPEPARVRREHARLRLQPGARQQRRLDRGRDHRRLLVRCLGLLARHQGRRRPRQRRPDHRHPDPGRRPGPPRRGLPRSGQRVRCADDRRQPAAGLGRALQPRAHRQQLPVLLRHGDERRARRRR